MLAIVGSDFLLLTRCIMMMELGINVAIDDTSLESGIIIAKACSACHIDIVGREDFLGLKVLGRMRRDGNVLTTDKCSPLRLISWSLL
jgi:hypothetical protein